MPDRGRESEFLQFARRAEPGLRAALVTYHGAERGLEATNDALLYGWRNWDRISRMRNPAGYLYRVGQRAARRRRRTTALVGPAASERQPWVEPGLFAALEALSPRQRQVVVLVVGYEWTQREVADLLGIRPASVQTHLARALASLRDDLGVDHE